MTDTDTLPTVKAFFDRYRAALLDRDAETIADLYAVPALILFPNQSVAVSDRDQTAQFFASSWDQYDGVHDADARVIIMAESGHSVWADVTWSYDGAERERFCYQLIHTQEGHQIAVLTPLSLQ